VGEVYDIIVVVVVVVVVVIVVFDVVVHMCLCNGLFRMNSKKRSKDAGQYLWRQWTYIMAYLTTFVIAKY